MENSLTNPFLKNCLIISPQTIGGSALPPFFLEFLKWLLKDQYAAWERVSDNPLRLLTIRGARSVKAQRNGVLTLFVPRRGKELFLAGRIKQIMFDQQVDDKTFRNLCWGQSRFTNKPNFPSTCKCTDATSCISIERKESFFFVEICNAYHQMRKHTLDPSGSFSMYPVVNSRSRSSNYKEFSKIVVIQIDQLSLRRHQLAVVQIFQLFYDLCSV